MAFTQYSKSIEEVHTNCAQQTPSMNPILFHRGVLQPPMGVPIGSYLKMIVSF